MSSEQRGFPSKAQHSSLSLNLSEAVGVQLEGREEALNMNYRCRFKELFA